MLELLFALSIWILGFIAIISLFQLIVEAGRESKQKLIAANLAQEGVEIVHNIRDSNYNDNNSWDNGFRPECFNSNCELDYQSTTTLDKGDDVPLEFSSSTGAYGYDLSASDASPSPYRRYVRMEEDVGTPCTYASSSECIQVKVEVAWQRRGKDKSVEVENYIFDWD